MAVRSNDHCEHCDLDVQGSGLPEGCRLLARSGNDCRSAVTFLATAEERFADQHLSAYVTGEWHRGQALLYAIQLLGDVCGPLGVPALRAFLADPQGKHQDLFSVAIIALDKRDGTAATPVFQRLLADRRSGVKEYALCALAFSGDDRAWEDVLGLLTVWLRPSQKNKGPVMECITYLARQLNGPADARLQDVADLMRKRAGSLTQSQLDWCNKTWPTLLQDGPVGLPNITAMEVDARRWAFVDHPSLARQEGGP
jgi:hypothetical protein